jgi:hypothetical protein
MLILFFEHQFLQLTMNDTLQLLHIHVDYCNKLSEFYEKRNVKKFRLPNFPEMYKQLESKIDLIFDDSL